MAAITKEMKIFEVTKKYPKAISVLGNFKIDFCCCGARSLEEAARSRGVDVDKLIEELNRVTSNS